MPISILAIIAGKHKKVSSIYQGSGKYTLVLLFKQEYSEFSEAGSGTHNSGVAIPLLQPDVIIR